MAKRTIKTIRVAGGNLFVLAAQYLGDASQWNRIAQLNDMTDPFLADIVVLKMPPVDRTAGNGGILEI